MSTPDKKNIHHVYGDIEEEDNSLPNWWLAILFGSMIFSVGYWWLYHNASLAAGPTEAYLAEKKALEQMQLRSGKVTNESLLALKANSAALDEGAKTFATVCASCHAANGSGTVGPNLTDAFWIHGNKPLDLYRAVSEGFANKGMPAWEKTLGPVVVRNVTAYVMTLEGKNLPGKAPEGTELSVMR